MGCKANLAKDMQQLYWAEKIRSKLFETSLGDPHLWEVKRESEIKIKLECEKKVNPNGPFLRVGCEQFQIWWLDLK